MNKKDHIQRFLFDKNDVRGEIVQLDKSWQQVLSTHSYPDIIQHYLGEIVAATVLLAAILKIDGSLSIQVTGKGAVNLLIAECRHDLSIRAVAKYDSSKLNKIKQRETNEKLSSSATNNQLSSLLHGGSLVITIEQSKGARYQGIVELKGNSFAEVLENHLLKSEQLRTKIVLSCDKTNSSGLLLQELPLQFNSQTEQLKQWEELSILASTITAQEFVELEPKDIISRLFNEYNIRVFEPQAVEFKCSCSRPKVANMLLSLDYQEAKEIIHQSEYIEVNCEFCNQLYRFDELDITEIFSTKYQPTIH